MEAVAGPSGILQQQKTINIWNNTKSKGKVVSVVGFTDLVTKVREKFEETQTVRFKIVCEDACEIDDDDGLFALGNVPLTLFYVIEGEEFEALSQSEPTEKDRFQALIESLKRRKKGSETSARATTAAVIQHLQTHEPVNTNAPITAVVQPLQSNTGTPTLDPVKVIQQLEQSTSLCAYCRRTIQSVGRLQDC